MAEVRFWVPGIPIAKGSMKAVGRKGGKVHLINDNKKTKPWQKEIAWAAMACSFKGEPDAECAWAVFVDFYFERTESSKRKFPTTKPDGDKLLRTVFDALTGVVYADDSQVTSWGGDKHFVGDGSRAAGISVTVKMLGFSEAKEKARRRPIRESAASR